MGTNWCIIRTTDAINSKTFIAFLQELLKTCPKFVMIRDNADMHSTGQNNPLILTKNAGIHRTSSDIIRIALQFFKDV